MYRRQILDCAIECVTKTRQDMHGDPENSFWLISDLWENYLRAKHKFDGMILAEDVAWMMVLLKVARAVSNPKNPDNPIDAAGYAALAGELADENR